MSKLVPEAAAILARVDVAIDEYRDWVKQRVTAAVVGEVRDAPSMLEFEQGMMARARKISDECVGITIDGIVSDSVFEKQCIIAARADKGPLVHGGRRDITITLLGGGEATVATPYLRPDLSDRPGPTRGSGKRGPGGSGLYPVLLALGISFTVTPAAASEILRSVVGTESVRVARETLASHDLDLGHERTLRIVNHFGDRIVEQLNSWYEEWKNRPLSELTSGPLSGKRVVVAVDGGRIRIRIPKPGRPQANGHRRYDAPWVEPKELTIYTVDEAGRRDESFPVVLDGTLGDADAIFDRLVAYLKALGGHEAEVIIALGDGAEWIWNRAGMLASRIGIDDNKIVQIVDFYHGAQYLSETVDMIKWNSPAERDEWAKECAVLLESGQATALAEKIDLEFAKSADKAIGPIPGTDEKAHDVTAHAPDPAVASDDTEKVKKQGKRSDYFRDNEERMDYATFKANGYPIGSGAIESGIKRVINLRIKATSKFWLEENAEHMIRMRSYLRSGRFRDLFTWSLTTAASWWRAPTNLLGNT